MRTSHHGAGVPGVVRRTVVSRETLLPSPPLAAFEAVHDPATAPLIDPAVREWTPDREPVGVGTRFRIRGRLGVIPIRGTSEVDTWEPPHRSRFRSVAPDWPFRMTATHEFEAVGERSTSYRWSITFEEVSRVGRPFVALSARLFRTAMSRQASALSDYLSSIAANRGDP